MPKPLKIILIILGSIITMGLFVLYSGTRGMDEIRTFSLPATDMNTVADGDHEGSCTIGRWAMKVRVTVMDHRILDVVFVDGKSANMTDDLAAENNRYLIAKQALVTDAVGGASITTRAYMIAIGDALTNGK